MLSVNDCIHGWSPVGDGDEDVNISQDICFMTIKPFSPPWDTDVSTDCPPLQSIPLAGVTHVPPISAPSSDRRTQRNRNRDPSWIPRPRNAFIIFRCEHSREYSQGSRGSQNNDESTNTSVKTLSKRAAEAWKRLPPSERERYKLLADKEREEHARLYPHYRFRPMKRQISNTRKTASREHSSGPSVECPPVSSVHLPSVLAPAPDKSQITSSLEISSLVFDTTSWESLYPTEVHPTMA